MSFSRSSKQREPGQGALEYLLLIGGAVLIATLVLVMVIGGIFPATSNITNQDIQGFQDAVTLNAAFGNGGGANLCGQSGQVCASGSSQNCTVGGYAGNQSCNANCSGYGSCTSTLFCGDNTINGPEICDNGNDAGCSGGTPTCNATCSACVASGSDTTGGFSFLGVSAPILASTPGYAEYTFNWTGSSFVSGMGANKSGIGVVNGLSYPVAQNVLDGTGAMAASSPVVAPKPVFSPANGSNQKGWLSNAFIKNVFLAFSSGAPQFGILGDVTGNTQYQLASANTPAGTFPTDAEAPTVPTPSVSTGASNGANLSLSWTEPNDNYLGATYPSTTDYTIVYNTSPITVGNIAGLIVGGQTKTGSATGGTAVAQTLNYQTGTPGLIPSQSYYSAVVFCDKLDAVSANSTPNCNFWTASSATPATKEAFFSEAEAATTLGSSILQPPTVVSGETAIKVISSGCSSTAPANEASYAVTLKAPTSVNTTYRVWLRGRNTNLSATNPTVKIGASSTTVNFAGSTSAYTWRGVTAAAASSTISAAGGNQNLIIAIQCTSQGLLAIDKVLITSDLSCDPNTATCT